MGGVKHSGAFGPKSFVSVARRACLAARGRESSEDWTSVEVTMGKLSSIVLLLKFFFSLVVHGFVSHIPCKLEEHRPS
jgi:hypothetical protein